jgi:hypothetical protein
VAGRVGIPPRHAWRHARRLPRSSGAARYDRARGQVAAGCPGEREDAHVRGARPAAAGRPGSA